MHITSFIPPGDSRTIISPVLQLGRGGIGRFSERFSHFTSENDKATLGKLGLETRSDFLIQLLIDLTSVY